MPFLVFVVIAVVTAAARLPFEHGLTIHRVLELFLLHALVVIVGLGGLFAFSGHVVRGRKVAEGIGWPAENPFQLEVGVSSLAFAVPGLLSIWFRGGFWGATVIGFSVFLLGAGVVHLWDLSRRGNRLPLNTGAVLWFDLGVPVAMVGLLIGYALT